MVAAAVLLRTRTVIDLVVVLIILVVATATARYALSSDKRALRERPPPESTPVRGGTRC